MMDSTLASMTSHDPFSTEAFLAIGILLFTFSVLVISIADLHSRNISASSKALWVFLLVLIPGIGGIAYLSLRNSFYEG
jgi:uncharacterized membrane protein YhaH (DUF805 family)